MKVRTLLRAGASERIARKTPEKHILKRRNIGKSRKKLAKKENKLFIYYINPEDNIVKNHQNIDAPTLKIEDLGKKYGKNLDFSIRNISFTIEKGELVGLLGPNGAGKSTTLKCVTGILPITEGTVEICGENIDSSPVAAKNHFSFVTDNHSVFLKMTGVQYLNFMADVYKVPTKNRQEIFDKLEESFHLGKAVFNLISSYSHGMKQKICMMGSLVHSPDLWIMDEPMVGLDPRTQKAVTDIMKEYVESGRTILFSSHNLDVVKRICSRAIVINGGKMVADVSREVFTASEGELEKYYFMNEVADDTNEEKVDEE